jgi:hypothetical protein
MQEDFGGSAMRVIAPAKYDQCVVYAPTEDALVRAGDEVLVGGQAARIVGFSDVEEADAQAHLDGGRIVPVDEVQPLPGKERWLEWRAVDRRPVRLDAKPIVYRCDLCGARGETNLHPCKWSQVQETRPPISVGEVDVMGHYRIGRRPHAYAIYRLRLACLASTNASSCVAHLISGYPSLYTRSDGPRRVVARKLVRVEPTERAARVIAMDGRQI